MIYLGCWGYTVPLPPTSLPSTSILYTRTYASVLSPNPGAGLLGLLASFLLLHTDVQSSGCKSAPSHSPSHPVLTIARAQATILSTSPPACKPTQGAKPHRIEQQPRHAAGEH